LPILSPLGGKVLPLNWDAHTDIIDENMGSPVFQNFQGLLESSEYAGASLKTFSPVNPG
jgi:hypothetical protein